MHYNWIVLTIKLHFSDPQIKIYRWRSIDFFSKCDGQMNDAKKCFLQFIINSGDRTKLFILAD